jgi:hypothetical protein
MVAVPKLAVPGYLVETSEAHTQLVDFITLVVQHKKVESAEVDTFGLDVYCLVVEG